MCDKKIRIWIKFNCAFFWSILFFIITLLITIIRIVFKANLILDQKTNSSLFDFSVSVLLTVSTLIIGFYWANYKNSKDIRISKIEHYIQDFTKSHKLIKNILEKIEYLKFQSISEIRLIINIIDEYFGMHYFDSFIGNNSFASIYISKQISNSMVYLNKSIKVIDKFFSEFKYQFKVEEGKIISIIDVYIKTMNENKKIAESKFGADMVAMLTEKKVNNSNIITISLLQSIDDLLAKSYIDKVLDNLKSINEVLKKKAVILHKAIKRCESHNKSNKNDSNFCLSSQYLIINKCIEKSW